MTDKEKFVEALKATGRAGVDKVVAELERLGFSKRRLRRAFMEVSWEGF